MKVKYKSNGCASRSKNKKIIVRSKTPEQIYIQQSLLKENIKRKQDKARQETVPEYQN